MFGFFQDRVVEIDQTTEGAQNHMGTLTLFKKVSVYCSQGNFLCVERNAIAESPSNLPQGSGANSMPAGILQHWELLGFNWDEPGGYRSFAHVAGGNTRLRTQRQNQRIWLDRLLPAHFHAGNYATHWQHGAMGGNLALLIALLFFSGPYHNLRDIMTGCIHRFMDGGWTGHGFDPDWSTGRGVVVEVWFAPPVTFADLLAFENGPIFR